MLSNTKPHEQFIVLIAGDIGVNHSSLNYPHQNIIAAKQYKDILQLIASTQFNLILLDLNADYLKLMPRIKNPLSLNSKTPIIAIDSPSDGNPQYEQQYSIVFDDRLVGPITEQQLNEIIDAWQIKAVALGYIRMILIKTKNNLRLTRTLFEKLFEELPLQITHIKDALENKQYGLAQEITHKLNGSVSFCGLTGIQQSANALEGWLLNNNYANAHRHFPILQQHILNLTRHQETILENIDKC